MPAGEKGGKGEGESRAARHLSGATACRQLARQESGEGGALVELSIGGRKNRGPIRDLALGKLSSPKARLEGALHRAGVCNTESSSLEGLLLASRRTSRGHGDGAAGALCLGEDCLHHGAAVLRGALQLPQHFGKLQAARGEEGGSTEVSSGYGRRTAGAGSVARLLLGISLPAGGEGRWGATLWVAEAGSAGWQRCQAAYRRSFAAGKATSIQSAHGQSPGAARVSPACALCAGLASGCRSSL